MTSPHLDLPARRFLVFLSLLPGVLSAQPPVISHTTPGALMPGKTTELIVHGENLSSATNLWTSFRAVAEWVDAQDSSEKQVRFNIAIPDGALSLGAVRLASSNGISNLHLLPIDPLPSVAASGTHQRLETAQELTPPVAVDGIGRELGFDYYSFEAEAAQFITLDLLAARMGTALDPVLRLLDANGKELAVCEDAPGFGPDARLRHQLPSSGKYFVEVRDSRYQGGAKHRYRLRVGGCESASPALQTTALPEWFLLRPELPVLREIEPNDQPGAATPFLVPALLKGRFSHPGDRDWFEFQAEQGQKLVFRGSTRSLGSPCDLAMQIRNTDGKVLAENNLSAADEGVLTNRFSEGGTHRLLVEELTGQGGPELVYRIEVTPFQPGFTLRVETDQLDGAPGETLNLKVTCARRDYNGPITLAVLSDPPLSITNNVMAEEKSEVELKLVVPAQLVPGQWLHFMVVGSARIGESGFEARASTFPAIRKHFPLLLHPPRDLDGLMVLGARVAGQAPEENSGKPRGEQ